MARVRLVCSDVLVDTISLSGLLLVENRETVKKGKPVDI